MKTTIHFLLYLTHIFIEWKMFQTKVVEEIKAHILGSVKFFFLKSHRLWENVEKYFIAGQATDENMAHAHWALDS